MRDNFLLSGIQGCGRVKCRKTTSYVNGHLVEQGGAGLEGGDGDAAVKRKAQMDWQTPHTMGVVKKATSLTSFIDQGLVTKVVARNNILGQPESIHPPTDTDKEHSSDSRLANVLRSIEQYKGAVAGSIRALIRRISKWTQNSETKTKQPHDVTTPISARARAARPQTHQVSAVPAFHSSHARAKRGKLWIQK
ncbi:hypothetical protein BKA80DRAFT_88452 [Phyllosticta citrichinensis]